MVTVQVLLPPILAEVGLVATLDARGAGRRSVFLPASIVVTERYCIDLHALAHSRGKSVAILPRVLFPHRSPRDLLI